MTDTPTTHWLKRPSWQRYMMVYFGIYIVIALALLVTLGPTSMSAEYLSVHKSDHDRYVDTTKLDEYKHWQQRPALVESNAAFAETIAFMESYTSNPEFIAEQRRRMLYDLASDFFRALMVLVLLIHFGRKPIAELLDGLIENVRTALERAHEKRAEADERKQASQAKLEDLPDEQAELEAQTTQRVEEMRRQAALSTGESLSILNRETEDRIQREETLARAQLKRELVDAAIETLAERYQTHTSPEEEDALVEQFVQHLGERT